MLFSKTVRVKDKRNFKGSMFGKKYLVTTYWFLFLPIFTISRQLTE